MVHRSSQVQYVLLIAGCKDLQPVLCKKWTQQQNACSGSMRSAYVKLMCRRTCGVCTRVVFIALPTLMMQISDLFELRCLSSWTPLCCHSYTNCSAAVVCSTCCCQGCSRSRRRRSALNAGLGRLICSLRLFWRR